MFRQAALVMENIKMMFDSRKIHATKVDTQTSIFDNWDLTAARRGLIHWRKRHPFRFFLSGGICSDLSEFLDRQQRNLQFGAGEH
jgi:hypothetical protein